MFVAEEEPEPQIVRVKDLKSNEDKICGGPEIWYEVTRDQTATGVQNIKWKKIDAIAEDYIKQQEMRIKTIGASLEHLAEDIKRLRAKEHIGDVSEEQIRELITASTKPFEGLETARRTNCGSPAIRPRAPTKHAMRKSVEGFGPEAEKVFQGSVKLGHAPFLGLCKEMLTCENSQASCYCEAMCQQLTDVARKVSDKNVGEHHGEADELVRKQNALQDELQMRRTEIAECESSKEQLKEFGAQIGRLKDHAHARFEVLQQAEERLYDAQEELADLEDDLKEEEAEEAAAMAILSTATGKFDEAVAALQKLNSDEQALVASVNGSVVALGKARGAMDEAMGADRAMSELRELVSVTLMKMEMFFDQAVQAPVRSLGIDVDLDLDKVFVGAPEEMTSAGAMREAVDSVARYCGEDGRGQAAIASMKEKVDLTPLCKLEAADEIKKDINGAVAEGLRIVRDRIEQVKGWLNPYRGQVNMNDTVADSLASAGEPAGLRRIISTYGDTGFYKRYLKHWKLGGPFLKLLNSLNSTVYSLQKAVDDMTGSLADLKEQLAKTVASREAAEQELERATADQQLAQEKQAELKGHVEAMRQQGEKMRRDIAELEAQVAEAARKYKEALERIKAAHQEGTSFLQSWHQMQEEAQDEQRVEAARARDHLLSTRIEADKAEQRYRLTMARISELEEQGHPSSTSRRVAVSAHRLHQQ